MNIILPFEIVIHIFCVAKYKRALQFLRTCAYFSTDSAWKLKFEIEFPTNPSPSIWTHRDHYIMIKSKISLALAVNFSDRTEISQYIYEYHPMLNNIIELPDNTGCYNSYELVILEKIPEKQIIVIKKDIYEQEIFILAECNDKHDAHSCIMKDKLSKNQSQDDDESSDFRYLTVKLKFMIPWFLSRQPVRNHICTDFYSFSS